MKIENTDVYGFEHAFRGMRNPLNSWNKSDSYMDGNVFILGDNDLKLAQNLILAGTEHGKLLRQIQVWFDCDMPRYWWSEFDTYHYNNKNSCSTMHKLLNKNSEITLDMFIICPEDIDIATIVIERLNEIREIYLSSTNQKDKDYCLLRAKRLLMEGFLQLRTINTNYAELRNMWLQRVNKPHRLKEEWVDTFGNWILSLPYAKELITYKGDCI